ncbi:uncharacterized protein V1518DRAFT_414099 [Limtongia smithiae]|uniref:uncharacterized protein n=1 Tax=Limtongia smithiae TaxID=1125753 RepID=UPI0034CDE7FC
MALLARADESDSELLLSLLENAFSNAQTSGKAVWLGLLTSLGSCLLVFATFCILRPRNTVIYSPKTRVGKYALISGVDDDADTSLTPPRLSETLLLWIKQIYGMPESRLVNVLGIDMVVYIKFQRMCLNIFMVLAFVGLTVAVPVDIIYSLRSSSTLSGSDAFLLMTPTLVTGTPIVTHIVLAYFTDAVVAFFLWRTSVSVLRLRKNFFASPEYRSALYARSILITELAKRNRDNAGIERTLASLPSEKDRKLDQVSIGRDVKDLGKLVTRREQCVFRLEKVIAKYLKDPSKIPATRPKMKPYSDDHGYESRRSSSGGKVDAINYLVVRIQDLEQEIIAIRKSVEGRREMPYGFASYATICDAHEVALENRTSASAELPRIQLAPHRDDILWESMALTHAERVHKQHTGNIFFLLLCFTWVVPNAFISVFVSQISRIGAFWTAFGTFMDAHQTFESFLQGVISPIVTSVIFLVLPIIMRRMSAWQGATTKSGREKQTLSKLYTFFVFNNLIVFTLFGVAWSVITDIIQLVKSSDDLTASEVFDAIDLASQLSTAILSLSSFWVSYIIGLNIGIFMDLLQTTTLIIRYFARRHLAPTPRKMIHWTAPSPFSFATNYNWLLFYATIGLTFTTIQPLILVVTAFYFCLDAFIKRYSFMYVYVTKVESGGMFWKCLFDRVLFACGLGNVVIFLVTWTQGGWKLALAVTPTLPLLIAFKIYSDRTFDIPMNYDVGDDSLKLSETMSGKTVTISTDDLRIEFGNPSLYRKLIVPMVRRDAEPLLEHLFQGCDAATSGDVHRADTDLSTTTRGTHRAHKLRHDGAYEVVDTEQLDIVKFASDPNLALWQVHNDESLKAAEYNAAADAAAKYEAEYTDDERWESRKSMWSTQVTEESGDKGMSNWSSQVHDDPEGEDDARWAARKHHWSTQAHGYARNYDDEDEAEHTFDIAVNDSDKRNSSYFVQQVPEDGDIAAELSRQSTMSTIYPPPRSSRRGVPWDGRNSMTSLSAEDFIREYDPSLYSVTDQGQFDDDEYNLGGASTLHRSPSPATVTTLPYAPPQRATTLPSSLNTSRFTRTPLKRLSVAVTSPTTDLPTVDRRKTWASAVRASSSDLATEEDMHTLLDKQSDS